MSVSRQRTGHLLRAGLCISAGFMAFLIITRLASVLGGSSGMRALPFESVAQAQLAASQMVASGNGYSILSTVTGGEAYVLVHDARNEEVVVYRSDSQGALQLSQRIHLQNAFVEGRARFGPNP
ncbi:MAG: hypothetical protein KF691_02735 [Phycisphaeraceae bacterium]|nr:hypothetical protein [Phycisphaeraceae bacterium]